MFGKWQPILGLNVLINTRHVSLNSSEEAYCFIVDHCVYWLVKEINILPMNHGVVFSVKDCVAGVKDMEILD